MKIMPSTLMDGDFFPFLIFVLTAFFFHATLSLQTSDFQIVFSEVNRQSCWHSQAQDISECAFVYLLWIFNIRIARRIPDSCPICSPILIPFLKCPFPSLLCLHHNAPAFLVQRHLCRTLDILKL